MATENVIPGGWAGRSPEATRPTIVQQRSTLGVYRQVSTPPAPRLRGGAGVGEDGANGIKPSIADPGTLAPSVRERGLCSIVFSAMVPPGFAQSSITG